MVKLTPAQRRVLQNIEAGLSVNHGLYGRSAHGGLQGTLVALHRRGYLTRDGDISAAGRTALSRETEVKAT